MTRKCTFRLASVGKRLAPTPLPSCLRSQLSIPRERSILRMNAFSTLSPCGGCERWILAEATLFRGHSGSAAACDLPLLLRAHGREPHLFLGPAFGIIWHLSNPRLPSEYHVPVVGKVQIARITSDRRIGIRRQPASAAARRFCCWLRLAQGAEPLRSRRPFTVFRFHDLGGRALRGVIFLSKFGAV